MDDTAAQRKTPGDMADSKREPAPGDDYINADDLFYWMADEEGADIPLAALGLEVPLCCRFCI